MFKENLEVLPVMQGKELVLLDESGVELARIANAPGTAGSFRVYGYLADKHGAITVAAAREGLDIYAEHTEDARLNPGKHPNIDRLISVMENQRELIVRQE